jgi:DNA polymerase III delta subunit
MEQDALRQVLRRLSYLRRLMKLRGEQLEGNPEQGAGPVWLVSGRRTPADRRGVARIRRPPAPGAIDERQSLAGRDGHFDWRGWLAGFDSLSLFSSRRLVEMRLPTGKPGIEGGKTLEAWAANPPADTAAGDHPRLDKASPVNQMGQRPSNGRRACCKPRRHPWTSCRTGSANGWRGMG